MWLEPVVQMVIECRVAEEESQSFLLLLNDSVEVSKAVDIRCTGASAAGECGSHEGIDSDELILPPCPKSQEQVVPGEAFRRVFG